MTGQKPTFPVVRKGYDQKDVDAYVSSLRDQLHGLREDLAKAQEEITVAQDEVTTAQAELAELRNDIDSAKLLASEEAASVLQAADESATAAAEEAQRRADEIIASAETAAEEIRGSIAQDEEDMRERLRTRENEITEELDAIDAKVGERTQAITELEQRLTAEESRYGERINTLRTIASSLEDALRAVVDGSLVELGVFLETQKAAVVDNEIVDAAVHHHFTTDALLAAAPKPERAKTPPAKTPAPSASFVERAIAARDTDEDDAPVREGQSFYSRRSAGLPSLGDQQGQSIIAAMGALRSEDEDDDDDEPDDG